MEFTTTSEAKMPTTIVHAQHGEQVYRIPFQTYRQAQSYCVGVASRAPERAIITTQTRVIRFEAGRKIGQETLVAEGR